jgi:hypothetical protein
MQSLHYHSSLEPFLDTLPFYTRYVFTLPPHFCKETRPFQLLTSILAFRTPKKGHSTRTPPQQNTYFPSPLPTPPTLSIKSQLSKFPSSYLAFTLFLKQKKQIQSHLYHQTPKLRRISDAPITFASRRCHCPTIVGLGSADGHRQHSTVFQNCYLFELDVRVFG